MTNEHHKVEVVKIEQVLPHPGADRLEIIPIQGYQAIVAKGQFLVGDLAYYIPPDSVVPEREEFAFLWGNAVYEGGVPVRKRRITAKKLRGEWSEGLLMGPCNSHEFPFTVPVINDPYRSDLCHAVAAGTDVAEILGITHYDTEAYAERTIGGTGTARPKRHFPRSIRGWLGLLTSLLMRETDSGGPGEGSPVYGVEAFKKFPNVFQPGEVVVVTEKIHGSNARFTYRKGLFGFGKFYVGSHNVWRSATSSCIFRRCVAEQPWIEKWCRANPGYTLYGEVVPTQKKYSYGCNDTPRLFWFDVKAPNGHWLNWTQIARLNTPPQMFDDPAPLLYVGPFDVALMTQYVDGPSAVTGADHIREGIVIKALDERSVPGLGRVQLKIVSNDFLNKDETQEFVITDRMAGVDCYACEDNIPHTHEKVA